MIHYTSPLRLQITSHICKHDLKGQNGPGPTRHNHLATRLATHSTVQRSTRIGMRHGHVPEAEARSRCAPGTHTVGTRTVQKQACGSHLYMHTVQNHTESHVQSRHAPYPRLYCRVPHLIASLPPWPSAARIRRFHSHGAAPVAQRPSRSRFAAAAEASAAASSARWRGGGCHAWRVRAAA